VPYSSDQIQQIELDRDLKQLDDSDGDGGDGGGDDDEEEEAEEEAALLIFPTRLCMYI
jgi:hypothetical protein